MKEKYLEEFAIQMDKISKITSPIAQMKQYLELGSFFEKIYNDGFEAGRNTGIANVFNKLKTNN